MIILLSTETLEMKIVSYTNWLSCSQNEELGSNFVKNMLFCYVRMTISDFYALWGLGLSVIQQTN